MNASLCSRMVQSDQTLIVIGGVLVMATLGPVDDQLKVNVTDCPDGLAAGSALFGFIAIPGIAFWALRNPRIYGVVVNPHDLTVWTAAFAGGDEGSPEIREVPA